MEKNKLEEFAKDLFETTKLRKTKTANIIANEKQNMIRIPKKLSKEVNMDPNKDVFELEISLNEKGEKIIIAKLIKNGKEKN